MLQELALYNLKLQNMKPSICIGCHTLGIDLEEYKQAAEDEGMNVEEYIIEQEGTYNSSNGHFYCTSCYIKSGEPLGIAP
jgi:hypothetical protein